ncbi:hypothetical protein [Psychrobacter raelei]|uniref:hypothetical protein n=1 Tax=Psychrobacter raelei TaxID=2565531 RepID=UPI003F6148D9
MYLFKAVPWIHMHDRLAKPLLNGTFIYGLSVVALGLGVALPAWAMPVYKTTGEFGEVKYSQFAPNFAPDIGTQVEIIQMRGDGRPSKPGQFSAPVAPPQTNTSTQPKSSFTAPLLSSSGSTTAKNNQAPHPSKTLDPTIQTQCKKLQVNLMHLTTGDEVYTLNATGQRVYLTAPMIELKRENTEQLLAQYC